MLCVSSIILSMTIISFGSGILNTFVPIELASNNTSSLVVGISASVFSVGLASACLLSGRVISVVGHIRSFAFYAAIYALSVNLLMIAVDQWVWVSIRFVQGFCATSLFMIAVSWMNEVVTNETRGRITTLFYLCYTVGFGIGANLISVFKSESQILFALSASFFLVGLLPIAVTRTPQPDIPEMVRVRLKRLYTVSPMGAVGAFAAGCIGMTAIAVAPAYGLKLGFGRGEAALLVVAYQFGNLLLQLPLGYLSDRIDRRIVAIIASALVASAGVAMYVIGGAGPFWLLLFVIAICGGAAETIYSLASAHANDHANAGEYSTIASTQLVIWSCGAGVGPLIVTQGFDTIGAQTFPLYIVAGSVMFMAFVIWRRMQREEPAVEEQETYLVHPHIKPLTVPMETAFRDELENPVSETLP